MGFVRVNLAYFMSDAEINYICDAIDFVSRFGWMLLPHYKFDFDLGIWVNREESEQKERAWLGEIDYSSGQMQYIKSTSEQAR